jgi:hypothetical protein
MNAIPSIRGKAGYVRSLVLPDREFLEARTGEHASYVRRWGVALRWLKPETHPAGETSGVGSGPTQMP